MQVADLNMWLEIATRNKPGDENIDPSESSSPDPGSNIYAFGLIMLETISGRLLHTEEDGSILNWVSVETNLLPLSCTLASITTGQEMFVLVFVFSFSYMCSLLDLC